MAQNPVGSVMPPLPASQASVAAAGVGLAGWSAGASASVARGAPTGLRSVQVTVTSASRVAPTIRGRFKSEKGDTGSSAGLLAACLGRPLGESPGHVLGGGDVLRRERACLEEGIVVA